jgi:hypothetical protein
MVACFMCVWGLEVEKTSDCAVSGLTPNLRLVRVAPAAPAIGDLRFVLGTRGSSRAAICDL